MFQWNKLIAFHISGHTMKSLFFVIISFALMTACDKQQRSKNSSYQKQSISIQMSEKQPTYLYKVLSMDDWGNTCKTIHLSSMDSDFIHFSTEEQLDKIIEKYWADVSEYVVLKVETAKLPGNLVLEANPGGTNKYYHLYNGAIPLTSIIELKVYKK